jgi:hypothetical protein
VQLRKYSAKPDGLSEPSRRFQTDGIDSISDNAGGQAGSTPGAKSTTTTRGATADRQTGAVRRCSVLGFSVMRPGSEAEA